MQEIIYLVDDQPMNVEVLKSMLEKKLERNVECFHSGQEAIRRLRTLLRECGMRRHVRILVLMDINMPDMDGFEATHLMKQILGNHGNV